MSDSLVRLHDVRPGMTSAGLARGGSYERLWAHVAGQRVLDLACGDRVMPGAIGLDASRAELARASGRVVCARAQALPFCDRAFDAAVCHLAFMLFDDLPAVVAELARVLAPGATFHALVGGGPTGDGRDAFHVFAEHLPRSPGFGDPRANREDGWRELFAGWNDIAFERWPIDLAGSLDDVWAFLAGNYQLADADATRAAVRAAFPEQVVPCTVATYYARVTR